MEGVGERMKKAMEARGFAADAVAKRLSVNPKTFGNYLADISEPKFELLLNFCEITGASIDQIIRRNPGEEPKPLELDPATMEMVEMLEQTDPSENAGTHEQPEAFRQIAFRSDWLNRLGIKASEAALVTVSGGEMTPTFKSGDVVMIDKRHTDISVSRGVYACRVGGTLKVARIAYNLKERAYLIEYDNYDVSTEVHRHLKPGALEVLGKVVWVSKVWSGDRR